MRPVLNNCDKVRRLCSNTNYFRARGRGGTKFSFSSTKQYRIYVYKMVESFSSNSNKLGRPHILTNPVITCGEG